MPNHVEGLDAKLRARAIPSLNGLRALAILLVFLVHAGLTKQTGVLGVEGFFVLSGFLITWKILDEFEATGTVSLRQFYRRRILRIFPAFYAFWIFSVGLILIFRGSVPWGDALAAFFYVSNYYHGIRSSVTPYMLHTWSLSVEEQFYLLWPALFLASRSNLRRLTIVLAWLIVTVWTYRALLSCVDSPRLQWYIFTAFEMRMDQLAVGCLLAIVLRRKLISRFWTVVCSTPYFAFPTVGLLCISEQFVDNIGYRNGISFMIDPVFCAILIVQAVAFSETTQWRWLNSPAFEWIGKLSYSIYLYHEFALGVGKRLAQGNFWIGVVAGAAITLSLAAASHYLIERPFLRLKKSPVPPDRAAPLYVPIAK